MSAAALIEQLHAHGIRLVAANDGVNLRVSGKPLTPGFAPASTEP